VIPVSEPLLDGRAQAYLSEAFQSGWISSSGPFIEEFEKRWSAYCGVGHGVAVSSGTAALTLAVQVLELPKGSEIIVPSFTIISCIAAILNAGCRPVLVDCMPDTWCLDVAEVARKITPRTRAIMPVHIYGHVADMDPLLDLAQQHDLVIIEDAAEAHGAEYSARRAGGIGALGCFSFYANKIITTGEGGMVVMKDPTLAANVRSLRNLCFQPGRRFWHEKLGHNFRMTNLQAAIGVSQMETIDGRIARKRAIAARYTGHLGHHQQLVLPVEKPGTKNVYWMYGVVLSDEAPFDATTLGERLRERNIETRPFFVGMHEQPALRARGLFAQECYPVTERLSRRGLYLPSGLTLKDADIDAVCDAVRVCLQ
jgi:perosamine synthetase